jgi:hypothetical protein
MLSTPVQEFPQFPAAISLLPLLAPADALQQLETRQARLIEHLAAIDEEVRIHAAGLPRLFLLESEYRRAVLEAEMKWVGSVITDLRGGQLDWTDTWMRPDVPPESEE